MHQTIEERKIRRKSFIYRTAIEWKGDRAGILSSAGKPEFRVASPPEFKGEEGVWTPEDLYVAAVNVCTMTTFAALAQKMQLPVVDYTSDADGTLEFADGKYRFTTVTLRPRIVVDRDVHVEAARLALEEAHANCMIGNSICARVVMEPSIVVR